MRALQAKQELLQGTLLHVEGHFGFQPLLTVALSADSAVTVLCVVYD